MKIELKRIDKSNPDKIILERINTEAISECERNSLDDLIETDAEVLGIYLDGEPVGFFVLREYKFIEYLAYFAISSDVRSKGIGSKALSILLESKKDFQMVVEYENPSSNEPDDMNMRRRDFYLRNGFYETGWYSFYDETEFEIGCSSYTFDEKVFGEFTEYLSRIVSDHIPKPYRKD
ncbi:MAG: GNAT family N-acetyltransferase [Eubacterium sp.]|nr:GNAT family N-acetyltransferase [Eubacterium sp.]